MLRFTNYFFCLLLLLGATGQHAYGQLTVEQGEPIDETVARGVHCVLQLSNGNTFVLMALSRNKFRTQVYDKQRKKIADQELETERTKLNDVLLGAYEIGGAPVLFYKESYGRTPALYRLQFAPETGTLVAEDVLYEFSRPGLVATPTETEPNDYIVVKDAGSDCYAAVLFHGTGGRKDFRMRMMHFDGKHRLLHDVVVPYPNDEVKNYYATGAVVRDSTCVYLAAYGTPNIGYRNGTLYLTRIDKNTTVPVMEPMRYSDELKQTNTVMRYDRKRNMLIMLINTELRAGELLNVPGNARAYHTNVATVDGMTMHVLQVHALKNERVTDAKMRIPGKERNYSGIAEDLLLCHDGKILMLMEELDYKEPNAFTSSGTSSMLGDIGAVVLEQDSVETAGYYIGRRQASLGIPDPKVMQMRGIHTALTANGTYLLGNEIAENIKRKEEGKRLKTAYRRDRQLVCYLLKDGQTTVVPLTEKATGKEAVFEEMIRSSSYDEATHTYATMARGEEEDGEAMRLRWIRIE